MELIQLTEDLILCPDAIIGIKITKSLRMLPQKIGEPLLDAVERWVFNIMLDDGVLVEVKSFDTREELIDFKNTVLLQLLTPKQEEVKPVPFDPWQGIGHQPLGPPQLTPAYPSPFLVNYNTAANSGGLKTRAIDKNVINMVAKLDTSAVLASIQEIIDEMDKLSVSKSTEPEQ